MALKDERYQRGWLHHAVSHSERVQTPVDLWLTQGAHLLHHWSRGGEEVKGV